MKNKTTPSFTNTSGQPRQHAERGVSLIVVLMFVFAISGITIWAARQAMLGEGMARNQLDLEVARQAAETALRDAERDIMTMSGSLLSNASCNRGREDRLPQPLDFSTDCRGGLCKMNPTVYTTSTWKAKTVTEPWWPTGRGGLWNNNFNTKPGREPVNNSNCNFTGGVPLGTFTGMAAVKGVAVQPEYLIEHFIVNTTQPTPYYRITARGFGYRQRTQVVLQTIFKP